jgi:hypothetical protein
VYALFGWHEGGYPEGGAKDLIQTGDCVETLTKEAEDEHDLNYWHICDLEKGEVVKEVKS